MTIYLDVIWLLNFFIDLILIWLTAYALKRQIRKWHFLLAALFASTVVFILFTSMAPIVYQPLGKLLFSAFIVLIAFGYKRFTYFMQNLFMFYFVTFVVGGGLFALHFFWQSPIEILDGIVLTKTTSFGSTFSWIFVITALPLIVYFTKRQFQQVETRKLDYERIVKVEVEIEGMTIQADGLVDSGNQLYDPLTKAPVMIMEKQLITKALPNLHLDRMLQLENVLNMTEEDSYHPFYNKLRIIPYRAVGRENEFLVAIKPNRVTIYDGEKKFEVRKVLIGIEEMKLSNENDYEAIIHPKMFIHKQNKMLA